MQIVWLFPALAVVGGASTVIITWSETLPQVPPGMVHRNTLAPVPKAVTVVLACVADVMVPEPDTSVHCPPGAAVAASCVEVAQMV